jgi:hypothetical protein
MSSSQFSSVLVRWSRTWARQRRPRSRREVRCLPELAALEERALLSPLTVTNDSDSGSGSLRAALASAVAGDTINFAPSAYGTITLSSAPLEVATSVTIDGPGANKLAINGNNTFQDLLVDANVTATVSGLTLTGGLGPASSFGGGGAIYNDGNLTVEACVITNNSAVFDGGGIANSGNLTVTGSVVSDNTSYAGGGISNNPGAVLELSGSKIENNSVGVDGFGGGISNLGTATITGSLVTNNLGGNGGGMNSSYFYSPAPVTITDSVFSDNSAPSEGGGGGIEIYGEPVTIIGTKFVNNTAGTAGIGTGGAIAATGPFTLNISESLFEYNSAECGDSGNVSGGAIFAYSPGGSQTAALNVTNSSFLGNTAAGWYPTGGAISTGPGTAVAITGTSFTGNTITGVFMAEGGALYLGNFDGGQATITGSSFQGNAALISATPSFQRGAGEGGALYSSGSVTVGDSTFAANQAVGGSGGGFGVGGAIDEFGSGPVVLSNCQLSGNSAIGGTNGGWAIGGALAVESTSAIVSNSSFIDNQALGGAESEAGGQAGLSFGGAIAGAFALTDCSLLGNLAEGGAGTDGATGGTAEGGALNGSGTVTGCLIAGNTALGGEGGVDGYGGGIYANFTLTVLDTLITLNVADGGSGGGQGVGGGLYIASGTTTLLGTTEVVFNVASTSDDNIYGTYST